MPTYEYKCKDCGHVITTFQKLNDPPLEQCEACGSPNVFRVPGAVPTHFKGPGFYSTDNPKW